MANDRVANLKHLHNKKCPGCGHKGRIRDLDRNLDYCASPFCDHVDESGVNAYLKRRHWVKLENTSKAVKIGWINKLIKHLVYLDSDDHNTEAVWVSLNREVKLTLLDLGFDLEYIDTHKEAWDTFDPRVIELDKAFWNGGYVIDIALAAFDVAGADHFDTLELKFVQAAELEPKRKQILIESDGTLAGTVIYLDGVRQDDFRSIYFKADAVLHDHANTSVVCFGTRFRKPGQDTGIESIFWG